MIGSVYLFFCGVLVTYNGCEGDNIGGVTKDRSNWITISDCFLASYLLYNQLSWQVDSSS